MICRLSLPSGQTWRPAPAVNLPNSITLTRIFSIPLLIWILSTSRFTSVNGEKELLASALFIAASITDGIDGYLARKRGQITTMGMLLDPLADKLLIAAAFITLVQFNPSLVPAWIAVVIIGREFLVSGLRSIAASEGFTIEASDLGKFKMLVQIVSVVAVILDHRWKEWPVWALHFPRPLDCDLRHLVHGFAVAGVGHRLLRRLLVEDRPAGGKAPPPRLRPQPAEETRCTRHLTMSPQSDPRSLPLCLNEFSPEERALLLKLAHEAIASALERREISLAPPSPHLAEPRGAFTTLYSRAIARLRGLRDTGGVAVSRGRWKPRGPRLSRTRASAPVTREELAELEVSLSILSAPEPILPEEVEIGRHGLADQPGRTPRAAASASAGRARAGTASTFWSRPAAKPACRRMRGRTARD